MNNNNKHIYHLLPFLIWPLIASAISFSLQLGIFSSTFVFLGIPVVYLSFLIPKMIKKILLFSLATAIPFSIIVDYIAHYTGQWLVLNNTFPKFLGYIAIEDIIWAILFVYFVIMFYEYFSEIHRINKLWNPRMKILVSVLWGMLVIFFILYFTFPLILNIPYFYLFVGIFCMVIPSFIELFRRPNLLPKFLVTVFYFFFLTFVYELTALSLKQWTFPSDQYVGWVSLFDIQFPFEEFFFGFLFYSIITLVCYESFDDDEK